MWYHGTLVHIDSKNHRFKHNDPHLKHNTVVIGSAESFLRSLRTVDVHVGQRWQKHQIVGILEINENNTFTFASRKNTKKYFESRA